MGMTIREFNRQYIEPTIHPESRMVNAQPPLLPLTPPSMPHPMIPRDPVIHDTRPPFPNFENLGAEPHRYPPIEGSRTAVIQGVPRDIRQSCK